MKITGTNSAQTPNIPNRNLWMTSHSEPPGIHTSASRITPAAHSSSALTCGFNPPLIGSG